VKHQARCRVKMFRRVLLLSAASLPCFTVSPSTASQCSVDTKLHGIGECFFLVVRRAQARALVRALRRVRLQVVFDLQMYRRRLGSLTPNFGGSVLSVGKWLHHLRRTLRMSLFTDAGSTRIFRRSNSQVWTSDYFRQTYLIPFLELQRLQRDPNLAPYDGCSQACAFLMRFPFTMPTAAVFERM
jgi:hypothetical protein